MVAAYRAFVIGLDVTRPDFLKTSGVSRRTAHSSSLSTARPSRSALVTMASRRTAHSSSVSTAERRFPRRRHGRVAAHRALVIGLDLQGRPHLRARDLRVAAHRALVIGLDRGEGQVVAAHRALVIGLDDGKKPTKKSSRKPSRRTAIVIGLDEVVHPRPPSRRRRRGAPRTRHRSRLRHPDAVRRLCTKVAAHRALVIALDTAQVPTPVYQINSTSRRTAHSSSLSTSPCPDYGSTTHRAGRGAPRTRHRSRQPPRNSEPDRDLPLHPASGSYLRLFSFH